MDFHSRKEISTMVKYMGIELNVKHIFKTLVLKRDIYFPEKR